MKSKEEQKLREELLKYFKNMEEIRSTETFKTHELITNAMIGWINKNYVSKNKIRDIVKEAYSLRFTHEQLNPVINMPGIGQLINEDVDELINKFTKTDDDKE